MEPPDHVAREQRLLARMRTQENSRPIPEDFDRPTPQVQDHELIRPIGGGGYGEVWLARSVVGTYRAVKVVYRNSFHDDRPYEREFRGIQRFEPISRSNDNLVDILQIGRNDDLGYFYYVMELADDAAQDEWNLEQYTPRTLRSEIRRRGRLPFEECLQLALSLNLALGQLHRRGLIHRDIKPSNIIFIGGVPKLADIGLVTDMEEARSFVGTEGFIPPEGPNSRLADIYSLGKVLYEASMGKDRLDFPEPFTALGQAKDWNDLEELNVIILKACANNPQERYQSVEELHLDLALLQSGKSVKSKRRIEARLARIRRVALMVGGIAMLATTAYLFQRQQTRKAENLTARMQILNAQNLLARDDAALGMAHLAFVLRKNPENRVAAEHLLNALARKHFAARISPPLPHTAWLEDAVFSPDGRKIASVCDDWTVRVWDVASNSLAFPAIHAGSRINSLAFSPDNSRLIYALASGEAKLIDTATGAGIFDLKHAGSARAVAFHPSGKWIVTASADKNVCLWNADDGKLLYALAHDSGVTSLALSRDGEWCASTTAQGGVRVWNLHTREIKIDWSELTAVAEGARFSPDGRWLAVIFKHRGWRVLLWRTDAPSEKPLELPHEERIYTAEFNPKGERIVVASGDSSAYVWDIASRENVLRLRHRAIVYSAVFSPNGKSILTASVDQTARVWDAQTGKPWLESMYHQGRVIRAAFSPDGQNVLTASWDRTVQLWNVQFVPRVDRNISHRYWAGFAEFSPDGTQALSATSAAIFTANNINRWNDSPITHQAIIWNALRAAPTKITDFPPGTQVIAAQFTKAGPRACVAGTNRNEGAIWDLDQHKLIAGTITHQHRISSAHFNQNGLILATASHDGTVRLWDASSGTALGAHLRHGSAVHSVRFNASDNLLVTASKDGAARVWDVITSRPLTPELRHDGQVWFAQFSPDSRRVVSSSLDHTARIWSTNGTLIATLRHTAPVEYAEFSPDGTKVVTAAGDRTARLWDATTGKQLTEPLEHEDLVMTARFSPDNLRVVTASMDRTVRVWDVETGLPLGDPLQHQDIFLTASFSPDGSRLLAASADGRARIIRFQALNGPIPKWLPEVTEAVVGQRLNDDRIAEHLSWRAYVEAKEKWTSDPEAAQYFR